MCYTVGCISDLDEGFDQLGASPKVRPQTRLRLFRDFASGFVYRVEVTAGSACASARLARSSAAIWAMV
jgi:hypothetical protein